MSASSLPDDHVRERLLSYLAERLPDCPFDDAVDRPFGGELFADVPRLDLLEQIKRVRW